MRKLVFTNMSYILRIGIFVFVVALSAVLYSAVENIGIKNLEAKRKVYKEEPKEKKIDEVTIKVVKPIHLTIEKPNLINSISNCNEVLPIIYDKPINFNSVSVRQKKKKFIDYMLPQILVVNFEIEQQRKAVEKIRDKLAQGKELTKAEEKFLNKLMVYYKAKSINSLINRLHTNPPSLVLAQAIAESGWGTSRFYLEGSNAFGITAIRGKGNTIKMYGKNIYMRKYNKVINSIRDYYYSINVSWAFEKLRKVRLSTDDPIEISHHLGYYSTLRDIYIRRIQYIIKVNNLRKLDKCKINPIYIYEIPLSKYMQDKDKNF
jgi:Bax protein